MVAPSSQAPPVRVTDATLGECSKFVNGSRKFVSIMMNTQREIDPKKEGA